MIGHDLDYETMQEWGRVFIERERNLRPIHTIPYDVRKRKYSRWKGRPTQVGGSDTVPLAWNYKRTSQGDDDEPDDHQGDDTEMVTWSWTQTWSYWPLVHGAGGDPSEPSSSWLVRFMMEGVVLVLG